MRTATTIATALKPANPGRRFAVNAKDDIVAVWLDESQRWLEIIAQSIDGTWIRLPDYGLPLMNGAPAVAPGDWKEV
jgi:hypothetical protein